MSVLERFSLRDKVALVTGGAGYYGRQIVAALLQAGADTYVASRNLAALEELACRFSDYDGHIRAVQYDQGDESSILALHERVMSISGRIDVLVNNAVLRPMKGWADSAKAFAESMEVNATGLFVITRAFGDSMASAGRGSIINIGSIHGLIAPDPTIYRGTSIHGWYPDYFFHKGGLVNFTRFVASYYGSRNVRCNCISAGGKFEADLHSDTFVKQYSERTLLGRMADETDLMGLVVFLASEASSYITAANIPLDGGYTAK